MLNYQPPDKRSRKRIEMPVTDPQHRWWSPDGFVLIRGKPPFEDGAISRNIKGLTAFPKAARRARLHRIAPFVARDGKEITCVVLSLAKMRLPERRYIFLNKKLLDYAAAGLKRFEFWGTDPHHAVHIRSGTRTLAVIMPLWLNADHIRELVGGEGR